MSTPFADWVRSAIEKADLPRLVSERPAVVLERIARGAGATRWFHVVSAGDLELVCNELAPGSTVSFYFDNRIALLPYGDEIVMRILDLIAVHGDAVVGVPKDGQLEFSVDFVAGANELDGFAENLPRHSSVFVGAFPAADDDGHDAVTLTLPDRDGTMRRHPH
jgi:hypothetical protein